MGLFGKGKAIDFSISDEDATAIAWGRLVQLGMATEEAKRYVEEHPEDEDGDNMQFYSEIATAEAEYASRSWWQKIF